MNWQVFTDGASSPDGNERGQVKRVLEADVVELVRCGPGCAGHLAFDRAPEDRVWVPLRGHEQMFAPVPKSPSRRRIRG